MPKVSIIVPVYNVEKYIRNCLDSIRNQTFTDWECILVDDGSTDKSGAICDEYAVADTRIKAIHKTNGGVATARQTGVDAAMGEYLIHADPDDYVEPEMLDEMIAEIQRQRVDILVVDFYHDKDCGAIELWKQTFSGSTSKDLAEEILLQRLHGGLWNKIVKKASYKSVAPSFYPGVDYCEDVLIWVQMSKSDLSVGYLPKAYYHYVQHEESITGNFTRSTLETCKKYIGKLCSLVPEDSSEVRLSKEMVKYNAFCSQILSDKEMKELFPEIKTYSKCYFYLKPIYRIGYCGHQRRAHRYLSTFYSAISHLKTILHLNRPM